MLSAFCEPSLNPITFLEGIPAVRNISAKVLEYSSQVPILASSNIHLDKSVGPPVCNEAFLNPDPEELQLYCTVSFPLTMKSAIASIFSHAEKAPDDEII